MKACVFEFESLDGEQRLGVRAARVVEYPAAKNPAEVLRVARAPQLGNDGGTRGVGHFIGRQQRKY
jgi:hypothetical protein